MPRPIRDHNTSFSTASKSSNPIIRFLKSRKDKRQEAAELAARKMTDNRAANEIMLIETVEGINFVNNKIPPEYLNHKEDPNQPYGDLEYGARAICQLIKRSPNFTVDTREIDSRLLDLALMYQQAIAEGHITAAYAAKGALLTCITSIRNRLANVSPDLIDNFMDSSIKYMDTWLLLVSQSREADEIKRNVEDEQKNYDRKLEENKKNSEKLFEKLESDPIFKNAFQNIADQTATNDQHSWTAEERTVRKMLTDQRFSDISLQFSMRMLNAQEIQLKQHEGRIDTLRVKVEARPVPHDSNSLNKYNEEVDDLFKELARIDTETDEMLTLLEDIEGRMEILDNAPGELHLRSTMADQAQKELTKIKERQDQELKTMEQNTNSLFEKFGIRSQKEQEALVEQVREREQQIIEQTMREEQFADVSEMLFNED